MTHAQSRVWRNAEAPATSPAYFQLVGREVRGENASAYSSVFHLVMWAQCTSDGTIHVVL